MGALAVTALVALWIGFAFGFFTAALMAAARRGDELARPRHLSGTGAEVPSGRRSLQVPEVPRPVNRLDPDPSDGDLGPGRLPIN